MQYNNVLKKRLEEEKKEIVNVMISFRDEKKCARERQQVDDDGEVDGLIVVDSGDGAVDNEEMATITGAPPT